MLPAEIIASALRYPAPGSLAELAAAVDALPAGAIRRHLRHFVDDIGPLTLGEWEELHTSTLDLSPLFVPYVGHVVWGDNYRRGEFMADLKVDMNRLGVDLYGELPDHLEPILRYLGAADQPRDDLLEVLPGALDSMRDTLAHAASKNPYRHLLAAAADVVAQAGSVTIGAS